MRQTTIASLVLGSFVLLGGCGDGGSTTAEDDDVQPNGDQCESPAPYDFPLAYTMENGDLFIHTDGGDLRTAIGPWGAHASPHTGHFEGNAKSDWAAMFADSWDQLERLDGDGPCQKGDLCGMHIDDVTSRLPAYVAPSDGFQVTAVVLEKVTDSHEHDRYKWEIVGRGCPYMYGMGHVGAITGDLRQALIERGIDDPDSFETPGVLFEDYDNPIVFDRGATLGIPQIRYEEIEGHPGYLTGWGGVGAAPWAQIEYGALDYIDPELDGERGAEFRFLSQEMQAQVEEVLFKEGERPESFKYDQPWTHEWLWRAEMALVASDPFQLDEEGSLFSRLGGWFERIEGECQSWQDDGCNETVSIFPIHKDSPFYDSSLYDSADVSYLVIHREGDTIREGEVLTSTVDEVAGTLVFKWREPEAGYQRVSYRVIGDEMVMTFSGIAVSEGDLPAPAAIPADDSACADPATKCYTLDGFGQQQSN